MGRVARDRGTAARAGVLVAALTLAACTGSAEPGPVDEPVGSSSTAAPAPLPVATGSRRPAVLPVARVPLRGLPTVAGVQLVGDRVLFAACADCSRDGDTGALYAHDLRTGRTSRLAATRHPRGVAIPIGGSGNRVVWLDVAPAAPQFGGRTQWHLQVLDVATGRARTLAGTAPAERSSPPWAVVRDGLAAWQQHAGDALSGPVRVADLAAGTTRLATPELPGPLHDVSARALFYVGATPPGRPGPDVADPGTPSDAYALPLGGGPASPLTDTHDVGSVTTDGTTAVWTTPRGASADVRAAPLAGGAARVVYRGGNVERVVGRGFVAVLTDDDPVLEIAPLDGGRIRTVPDVPFAPAGLSADGARLAWVAAPDPGVDADARRPLELVVGEVR